MGEDLPISGVRRFALLIRKNYRLLLWVGVLSV